MKSQKFSAEALAKSAHKSWAEAFAVTETPPAGFSTNREISKQLKMNRSACSRKLSDLVKDGKAEMKMFKVKDLAGYYRPLPHYRLL
jgi:hypothetical protein